MITDNLTKYQMEDIVKSIRKLQEHIRYLEQAHNTHIQTLINRIELKHDIKPGTDLYLLKTTLLNKLIPNTGVQ